jgi:hypothetical protein
VRPSVKLFKYSNEEVVTGEPFTFTRVKYALSDGTEVTQSSGKPGSGR